MVNLSQESRSDLAWAARSLARCAEDATCSEQQLSEAISLAKYVVWCIEDQQRTLAEKGDTK